MCDRCVFPSPTPHPEYNFQPVEVPMWPGSGQTMFAPATCPVCQLPFGECRGMQQYGHRFSLDAEGVPHEPFRYESAARCAYCGACSDSDYCSGCYHQHEYDAGLDGWDE